LIRYFGNDDPATRVMLESILVAEEEHVSDMHDLLVAYEGVPSLAADPPYGRAGAAAPTHGNHETPHAVLDDQTLSGPQKFERLNQLKQDSVQLADAANEGMTGGEPAALAEVQHAIDALAEADPHAVPAAAA